MVMRLVIRNVIKSYQIYGIVSQIYYFHFIFPINSHCVTKMQYRNFLLHDKLNSIVLASAIMTVHVQAFFGTLPAFVGKEFHKILRLSVVVLVTKQVTNRNSMTIYGTTKCTRNWLPTIAARQALASTNDAPSFFQERYALLL